MTAELDRLVAVHEAGHGVVAVVLGVDVEALTIGENGGSGECRPTVPLCEIDVNVLPLILLGGPMAEWRVRPPDSPWHEETGARRDYAWVDLLARAEMGGPGWRARAWRSRQEAYAGRLVDQHWRAIETVALWLARRRILSGGQVADAVWG